MRLHAKSLDKKKMVLLAGALLAFTANAVVNRPVDGFLPAPSSLGSFLDQRWELPAKDENLGEAFKSATFRGKEDESLRPVMNQTLAVSDPSVVFLLSKNADGSLSMGTGTIIKGDNGFQRILTAAHVMKPQDRGTPLWIVAFDGEGKALAEVAPVIMAFNEAQHGGNFHASVAMNDIAVAVPISFFSEEARDTWAQRGARISKDQPAHPLFIASHKGDTTMNGGMSGASLRNDHGEVVGVFTHGTHIKGDYADTGSSLFLMKMYDQDDGHVFESQIQMLMMNRALSEKNGNGFGIAAPVLHPEILTALGVEGVQENPRIEAFEAEISGFPDAEGVTGQTYVTPMKDYEARVFIRDQFVFDFSQDTEAWSQPR